MVVACGHKAADWLAINACFNFIEKLLEESENGPYDDINWIVLPMVNPDGYAYRWVTYSIQCEKKNIRHFPMKIPILPFEVSIKIISYYKKNIQLDNRPNMAKESRPNIN